MKQKLSFLLLCGCFAALAIGCGDDNSVSATYETYNQLSNQFVQQRCTCEYDEINYSWDSSEPVMYESANQCYSAWESYLNSEEYASEYAYEACEIEAYGEVPGYWFQEQVSCYLTAGREQVRCYREANCDEMRESDCDFASYDDENVCEDLDPCGDVYGSEKTECEQVQRDMADAFDEAFRDCCRASGFDSYCYYAIE